MSDEAKKDENKQEENKEETTEQVELSKNAQKVMDLIKDLTAVELNELVKALEQEFDVSAAAPVMMAGGGEGGGGEGGGSDTVTVELAEIGQQKISVIKVVKEILGVGLKDAKEVVEKAPTPIKEDVGADEADELKGKLEEAGATVELK